MTGWHWAASIRRPPRYLNIPYWPHRIIVIGWGRLGPDCAFHPRQPCIYRMRLRHCCPAMTDHPWTPGARHLPELR